MTFYAEIEPVDSMLFRDGKPFSANSHLAVSVFPPFPYTFSGFLRSHFGSRKGCFTGTLAEQEYKMRKAGLGWGDDYGNFCLNCALLYCNPGKDSKDFPGEKGLYFPVPADILHEKKKEDNVIGILKPDMDKKSSGIVSSMPEEIPYWVKEEKEDKYKCVPSQPFSQGFISARDMEQYLCGNIKSIKVYRRSFFAELEPRTSVQIGQEGHGETGKLFLVSFLRFRKGISFYLSYNGDDIRQEKEELESFAGERRGIFFRGANEIKMPSANIRYEGSETKNIKVVLISPAFFENMRTPEKTEGLELVSAVTTGYEDIGGWDLVNNKPRLIRKAVRAGSVFYYKATRQGYENLIKKTSLTSCDQDSRAGMGKFLIGEWK